MEVTFFSDDIIMNIGIVIFMVLFAFLLFLFITFLISFLFRKKKQAPFAPMVSVIVPMYNEEKNIGHCLTSIASTAYQLAKIEVIVVDDASTDGSVKIVERFMREHKRINISIIKGTHQGKSEALNLGMKRASHDYLLTVDADVILGKHAIRDLIRPLQDQEVAATNSIAVIHQPRRLIEYFQAIEFSLNNVIRVSFSKVFKNSIWFFGAVACFRKKILEDVGGFKKKTLTEDMDISLELFLNGYRIVTVESAVISTVPMPTLGELFTQRMRWYYGALQSLSRHRKLLKKPSPPILFLFFNQYWWTFYSFVFFPLTIYQVFYWLPVGYAAIGAYLFRWFSIIGPFYVLYKIPEWGISATNIFAVCSGVITLILSIVAILEYKVRLRPKTIIALFFYFPYCIIINVILLSGIVRYRFSKKKYFMK